MNYIIGVSFVVYILQLIECKTEVPKREKVSAHQFKDKKPIAFSISNLFCCLELKKTLF